MLATGFTYAPTEKREAYFSLLIVHLGLLYFFIHLGYKVYMEYRSVTRL
jgi:hypothetical protein